MVLVMDLSVYLPYVRLGVVFPGANPLLLSSTIVD